jgi:hypothetical protein
VISFEMTDATTSDQLQIYLDREGLADLLAQLKFLSDDRTDHVHLMSESWGGSHLSEEPMRREAGPIRHVTVYMV